MIERSLSERRALGAACLLAAAGFLVELAQFGGPAWAFGVAMFVLGAAFQCFVPFLV